MSGRLPSGTANRATANARFRGRSTADLIAWCSALLAIRQADAEAAMREMQAAVPFDLATAALFDEDRLRGRARSARRWGMPPRLPSG